MDTIANCIVEHLNQKDYTMHANCEQVLLKGTLGELGSQNVVLNRILTLIPYKFSYLYWQSPITVSGEVHNVVDFLKKNKKIGPSYRRSCPWSRLFCLCQQQMPALNAPSVQ